MLQKELKYLVYESLRDSGEFKKVYYKFNTVMAKGKGGFFKITISEKKGIQAVKSEIIERIGNQLKIRQIPIAIAPMTTEHAARTAAEVIKVNKALSQKAA